MSQQENTESIAIQSKEESQQKQPQVKTCKYKNKLKGKGFYIFVAVILAIPAISFGIQAYVSYQAFNKVQYNLQVLNQRLEYVEQSLPKDGLNVELNKLNEKIMSESAKPVEQMQAIQQRLDNIEQRLQQQQQNVQILTQAQRAWANKLNQDSLNQSLLNQNAALQAGQNTQYQQPVQQGQNYIPQAQPPANLNFPAKQNNIPMQ